MTEPATALRPSRANVSWLLGRYSLPANVRGDHLALVWDDGSRTYTQLRTNARRLATALTEQGARPGDRIAVHVRNRGEIFEVYFACALAGLTLVPVNFRLSAREMTLILDDAAPRIVFTQAELADLAGSAADAAQTRPDIIVLDDHAPGPAYDALLQRPEYEELLHNDVQLILFTSGTTGRPKGVVVTHEVILAFAMQQCAYFPALDRCATTLITGPLYNTAAIHEQSIPTFAVGGTVAIMPSGGWSAERMAERMNRWHVTHTIVYPSMMGPMLTADDQNPLGLADLRFVITGGENCPPDLVQRFAGRWNHASVAIGYGSTETGIITTIGAEEIATKPGSVGRSVGVQSFVIRAADGNLAAPGQTGAIWTTGPATMRGYWRAPALDSAVIEQGWVDTGDLGYVDDEGYLFLAGRTRDVIISKGQNIYPAEVENALAEHPDVVDVAVIGAPDPEFGEIVCACVVIRSGRQLGESELVDFARDRLASFKKPRRVYFVDHLPRNPSGKVLKPELARSLGVTP